MGGRRKRTFGVELEYMFELDEDFERAVVKAAHVTGHQVDSSILHYRGSERQTETCWSILEEDSAESEVTTPALSNFKTLRAGMVALMKELGTINCHRDPLNNNCGCHVHVGVEDIHRDPDKVARLVQFFGIAEDYFFQLQPDHRKKVSWCRPVKELANQVAAARQDFWKDWKEAGLEESLTDGGLDCPKDDWDWYDIIEYWDHLRKFFAKQTSISLGSISEYKTVEIRLGSSSLSAEDVTNWTQICVDYIDKSIRMIKSGSRTPRFRTFAGFMRFLELSPVMAKWVRVQRKKYSSPRTRVR